MIDYLRVERAARGVKSALAEVEQTPEVVIERLLGVVEIQKEDIRRLSRLLAIGLEQGAGR